MRSIASHKASSKKLLWQHSTALTYGWAFFQLCRCVVEIRPFPSILCGKTKTAYSLGGPKDERQPLNYPTRELYGGLREAAAMQINFRLLNLKGKSASRASAAAAESPCEVSCRGEGCLWRLCGPEGGA